MANYLLTIRENSGLALASLKQFNQPNEVFFCDNFWKLYQIRRNRDRNTQDKLRQVLTDTAAKLSGSFVRQHLRELRQPIRVGRASSRRSRNGKALG